MNQSILNLDLLDENPDKQSTELFISRALSQSSIYYYGDLLEKLQNNHTIASQIPSWIELLEIYVFKGWKEYKQSTCGIELDSSQIIKLKELTLMSMACHKDTISFKELSLELDIKDYELHKFLIDAIYHGVISGMIDSNLKLIELTHVKPRDITPDNLKQVQIALDSWINKLDTIIGRTKQDLNEINEKSTIITDNRQQMLENIRIKGHQLTSMD